MVSNLSLHRSEHRDLALLAQCKEPDRDPHSLAHEFRSVCSSSLLFLLHGSGTGLVWPVLPAVFFVRYASVRCLFGPPLSRASFYMLSFVLTKPLDTAGAFGQFLLFCHQQPAQADRGGESFLTSARCSACILAFTYEHPYPSRAVFLQSEKRWAIGSVGLSFDCFLAPPSRYCPCTHRHVLTRAPTASTSITAWLCG